MIALYGTIRRRERHQQDSSAASIEGPPSHDASSVPVTADVKAASVPETTESSASVGDEWIWTGEWSFGATVDENSLSTVRLPFTYTWIQPSSEQKDSLAKESTVKKTENENSKVIASTPIVDQLTTGTSSKDTAPDIENESLLKVTQGTSASTSTAPLPPEPTSQLPSTVVLESQNDSAVTALTIAESTNVDSSSPALLPTKVEFFNTTLPASGLWRGAFDALVGRKGQQKRKRIEEHFVMQWNVVPDESTRLALAESAPKATQPDAAQLEVVQQLEKVDTNESPLLPNHVTVMGRGQNQYGSFVFVGTINTATGVLRCQKCYVAAASDPSNDTTSKTSKKQDKQAPRPYQTRKRHMSWKRRAAYDSGDDGNDKHTVGPDSERKQPPLKKQRLMEHHATTTGSSEADDVVGVSVGEGMLTDAISAPAAVGENAAVIPVGAVVPATVAMNAGNKRLPMASSSASPSRGGQSSEASGPKKRTASMMKGGGSSTTGASVATTSALAAQQAGQMKLPAAGDPHKARWRAAHFLYYHRDDPAAATTQYHADNVGTNGSNAPHAPTNASSTSSSPMYLVYEGEMLNSHRHGRGVCLYNNGMMYEGEWRRDKEQGRGILMAADRKFTFYEGEWERGKMHGTGVYYYMDKLNHSIRTTAQQGNVNSGSRYEGEFKENLRHGSGTYVLPNKSTYVGQWREGFMCGRGVFTWPDGSVYDGEWKDGKRHGLGLLKTSDGFSYDGGWVHNSMEGRGAATYPNGQQYNGLFSRGRREGRGTILFTNGAVYEGRFRDDAIDGQGTMKMSRTMVVPRSDLADVADDIDGASKKHDFMIPVSFQSDMGHIHRRAGFTNFGT